MNSIAMLFANAAALNAKHYLRSTEIRSMSSTVRGMKINEIVNRCDDLIKTELRREFPDYGYKGTGDTTPIDPSVPTWIYTGLDGQRNFVNGLPFSAVSVGLWHMNEPHYGVVVEVHGDDMYASSNAHRLRGTAGRREEIFAADVNCLEQMSDYVRNSGGHLRSFGCPSLSLALVAHGIIDGYVNCGIRREQAAGAAALFSEREYTFTSVYHRQPWIPVNKTLVAGSHAITSELRNRFQIAFSS